MQRYIAPHGLPNRSCAGGSEASGSFLKKRTKKLLLDWYIVSYRPR
jgi:hypothetical protein